jgi:hypothetical protein
MKKIFSAVVLECLEIDIDSGLDMVRSYSKQWLEIVDERPIPYFSNMEDYIEHRTRDSGAMLDNFLVNHTMFTDWQKCICLANRLWHGHPPKRGRLQHVGASLQGSPTASSAKQ